MIHTKTYPAPPYDRAEILRYAGAREASPDILLILEECLTELEGKLTFQVCWTEAPLTIQGTELRMGSISVSSAALSTHFVLCQQVILFAATVGIGLDRLIARYSRISPIKALLYQAIGAERIECLCDIFCRDIVAQQAALGKGVTRRFSPGYGDLPLDLQNDLFQILDCPRKIGLTLNQSLLMSPSKSVTALIGISPVPCAQGQAAGCAACSQESCAYRRTT